MELKEAIYQRRSMRLFQEREVEKEKICQLVDAAQWAPSACNKQGWRFIAVTEKKIKENIVKLAKANSLIKTAPTTIFVLYEEHLTENKSSYVQSAAAAIQNLLLTAHSMGLGATWLTGLGDLEVVKKELKVPAGFKIIAAIVLGYPRETPPPPQRREIEEILSFNCFNENWGAYPFTYNVKKWTLEKLAKFRGDGLRAASPGQNPFPFDKARELREEIGFFAKNISKEEKILEIMPFAGTHTLAMFKEKEFQNYYLFDLSKSPLDFTEQRFLQNNIAPNFKILFNSSAQLPYPDSFFDAVLVFQKLEMLPDLKIIDEIARVLKPGGKLLCSFKNMTGIYGIYYWLKFRLFNQEPVWNYGPFVPLCYFTIKKILKKQFKIRQEIGITPLIFIGKAVSGPISFLGRLVVLRAVKR